MCQNLCRHSNPLIALLLNFVSGLSGRSFRAEGQNFFRIKVAFTGIKSINLPYTGVRNRSLWLPSLLFYPLGYIKCKTAYSVVPTPRPVASELCPTHCAI